MTIHEAYQQLLLQLFDLYDDTEAANIADLVIEHITGQRKIDRVTNKELSLTIQQSARMNSIAEQLLKHMPVQYALNEAWFAGMKLYVDENVLIPRPETDELVEWVLEELRDKKFETGRIIDIGTGSGCIPIALKKKLPKATVRAIDISEGALNVAIKNAMLQAVQVYFIRLDFLDQHTWKDLGKFDIITSNPPYIRLSEACTLMPNVLEHEPHLALFVPDEDPLLFYRQIALFGKTHLEDNGAIFLEINEALGNDVANLYAAEDYSTQIKKDMQGKERMVKAIKK
jgi:release factor glutamine methyltransferase